MLHETNDITVTCVLVLAVEKSLAERFILAHSVALVDSYFNVLVQVMRQVWEWRKRLIEEFWNLIFALITLLDRFMEFVLCQDLLIYKTHAI